MKRFLTIILPLVIILTLGILEQGWITDAFSELESHAQKLADQCETHELTAESVEEACDWWQKKKTSVHIYVRHDAISDIDYRLGETLGYVKKQHYDLALAQLTVLLDMAKTIPLSFRFTIENIL